MSDVIPFKFSTADPAPCLGLGGHAGGGLNLNLNLNLNAKCMAARLAEMPFLLLRRLATKASCVLHEGVFVVAQQGVLVARERRRNLRSRRGLRAVAL